MYLCARDIDFASSCDFFKTFFGYETIIYDFVKTQIKELHGYTNIQIFITFLFDNS